MKNKRRFFHSELFNHIEGGDSDEMSSGTKPTLGFSGWGIKAPRAGKSQQSPKKLLGLS
jgi:hypothetical protein